METTSMSESEKIIYIVNEVFGAKSKETSVSMEEIIEKGVELGMTEPYHSYGKGDHPWWPHTAQMMGIGENVGENEEFFLHRTKMKKGGERVKMYYWYDRSKRHEVVRNNIKVKEEDVLSIVIPKEFDGRNLTSTDVPCPVPFELRDALTTEERFAYYEKAYPGEYILVDDKIIWLKWVYMHTDKFRKLYPQWIKENNPQWVEICAKAI